MKKKAFTLAEVLITIGIIGVVSAITIPALINDYQKRSTATKLKNEFARITQAVRLAEEEHGELAGWDFDIEGGVTQADLFDKYLAPFIKCSKQNVDGSTLKYYRINGNDLNYTFQHVNDTVFTTLSGVQYIVYNDATKYDSLKKFSVFIDLNGYNTLPNRFGRDLFNVQITENDGVKLAYRDDAEMGLEIVSRTRDELLNGPSANNYQCNQSGSGFWCGALIQRDGWKISKDYPWN